MHVQARSSPPSAPPSVRTHAVCTSASPYAKHARLHVDHVASSTSHSTHVSQHALRTLGTLPMHLGLLAGSRAPSPSPFAAQLQEPSTPALGGCNSQPVRVQAHSNVDHARTGQIAASVSPLAVRTHAVSMLPCSCYASRCTQPSACGSTVLARRIWRPAEMRRLPAHHVGADVVRRQCCMWLLHVVVLACVTSCTYGDPRCWLHVRTIEHHAARDGLMTRRGDGGLPRPRLVIHGMRVGLPRAGCMRQTGLSPTNRAAPLAGVVRPNRCVLRRMSFPSGATPRECGAPAGLMARGFDRRRT